MTDPSPEIPIVVYSLALRRAGVAARHALFVGDSLGHDVAGPAAMGLRTAWLRPRIGADPGDVRPDAMIHSLAEVLGIVGTDVSLRASR